jgi:hypothetical protein
MDYNICECCGTEFGLDDEDASFAELRERWVNQGAQWFFGNAPFLWNPYVQLFDANVANIEVLSGTSNFEFYGGQNQQLICERFEAPSFSFNCYSFNRMDAVAA